MGRREPSWDELRTFFEVVRDGSLSGAARRLALTQPTVGRHIDALEDALGLTLFTRSPRGLTATPASLALAPHGDAMAAAAAALARSASSESALNRGVVRVTASEIVGSEMLPRSSLTFMRVIRALSSSSPSPTATRTWRAATRISRCAWSVQRRADSSRAASAQRASASTRTGIIAPASASRARWPISRIIA